MLIGTSSQPGVFSEAIVTEMASHTKRPVIMPLSNPTSHSEAKPADLIAWTGGRVLVATGSPFGPVTYDGVDYQLAQANNALIFPGLGLGVTVARARRVSDGMLAAAAYALAGLSDAVAPGTAILPSARPGARCRWTAPGSRASSAARWRSPALHAAPALASIVLNQTVAPSYCAPWITIGSGLVDCLFR